MKTALGMTGINLKQSKTACEATGVLFAVALINYVLAVTVNGPDNYTVATGNYLYLLPLLMAIFVPTQNFSKLMNLGGKRTDFFISGILTYLPSAAIVSLLSILSKLTIDRVIAKRVGLLDLLDVFGFMERGAVIAFIQMFAFLLLFSCVVHTLTLIQGRWYGWVTDVIIIAIISVFTPIAPLRATLVRFFNMIIFHDVAAVQIVSCLIPGLAVYAASLIPIKSKRI